MYRFFEEETERLPINEKNLKSEIETYCIENVRNAPIRRSTKRISRVRLKLRRPPSAALLPIPRSTKRISRVRLKQYIRASQIRPVVPINEKNLKSEIETVVAAVNHPGAKKRSTKRISRVRLKLCKRRHCRSVRLQRSTKRISRVRLKPRRRACTKTRLSDQRKESQE